MTGPLGDLERADYPMDRRALRTRRIAIIVSWAILSAWEGAAIYLWFMKASKNPSVEVGAALALATCWMPVVGTLFAVMASVWAWAIPWWMAVAMYVGPRLAFFAILRTWFRRTVRPRR